MDQTRNIIAGVLALISLAFGTHATLALGVPFVSGIVSHWQHLRELDRLDRDARIAGREMHFAGICPVYAEASTWERWTNRSYWELGWCDDYLHRLPEVDPEVQFIPADFISD